MEMQSSLDLSQEVAYEREVKANILRSNYYWTLFYNFPLKTFHVS